MPIPILRRFRVVASAAVLVGAAVAMAWKPSPLMAQETKCYLVVCTGNVCVWSEVACPPPLPT